MRSLPIISIIFYAISACGFTIIFVLEDSASAKVLAIALLINTLFLYIESLRMVL